MTGHSTGHTQTGTENQRREKRCLSFFFFYGGEGGEGKMVERGDWEPPAIAASARSGADIMALDRHLAAESFSTCRGRHRRVRVVC